MFESDFNINPEITYLDCAGRSPLPLDVEKVGHLSVTSKVYINKLYLVNLLNLIT